MAKKNKTSVKAAKSAETKKQLRAQRRAHRKVQFQQFKQAFAVQRREDKQIIPILLSTFFSVFLTITALGTYADMLWQGIIIGLLSGTIATLFVFGRRAKKTAYAKAEGQIGAGAYVLENLRGAWRVSVSVAGNSHFDIVHRVLGLPGVILVGEGNPARVKSLISNEKKTLSKIVGSTPIYDVIVGNETGTVALPELEKYLRKLPKNIDRDQLNTLDNKLSAMKTRTRPPHGPLPTNARMKNIQRTMKRR